jgi:cold shock protein
MTGRAFRRILLRFGTDACPVTCGFSESVAPTGYVFAHYSAIASSGYRSLDENQKVQFDIIQGPKGPQAENIQPL